MQTKKQVNDKIKPSKGPYARACAIWPNATEYDEKRGITMGKLSFREKLFYGFGDFGSQFAFFIVNTYFMIFMTDVMGIANTTAIRSLE